MPEPDCFLRYRIIHSTPTRNPTYTYWSLQRGVVLRPTGAATRGFTMVSFTEAVSRPNTFVGGTCTPPSALLVFRSRLRLGERGFRIAAHRAWKLEQFAI